MIAAVIFYRMDQNEPSHPMVFDEPCQPTRAGVEGAVRGFLKRHDDEEEPAYSEPSFVWEHQYGDLCVDLGDGEYLLVGFSVDVKLALGIRVG